MFKNALRLSHELLKEVVRDGDLVVDATMGCGIDTLFLAQLVGETGQVLAFDVQMKAIRQTSQRLARFGAESQVILKLEGHENVGNYLSKNLRAAIFNLGYLPKSNRRLITKAATTTTALEAILENLVNNGRVVLVIYEGHDGGEKEKQAVLEFVKKISAASFTVLKYEFINQENNPPILIAIEKTKTS